MTTKTTKITITKSTVKVVNARDDKEFPRSTKKDGVYVTPWETGDKAQPSGWTNFKYAFTPDYSKVPSEEVSFFTILDYHSLVLLSSFYYVHFSCLKSQSQLSFFTSNGPV